MSTISASTTSTTAYKVTADTTGTLVLQTGATPTTAVTIDTAQNVGVGVTPSAWTLVTPALQIKNASLHGYSNQAVLSANWYYGSGDKYISNGYATQYAQGLGQHIWFTAPNGTAGTAISFTQAMTLDASGNFLVGKTVPTYTTNGVSLSNVGSNFSYTSAAAVAVNRNGTDGTIIEFYKAGTYVGNISVTGAITTYNSVSDYRLKNNPVPITGAKEFIMALKPKTWDWRNGLGKGVGFIAHEFMEVAKYSGHGEKDAVDEEGNIIPQSIQPSSSEVMANLVAHIQNLETRLAALENK